MTDFIAESDWQKALLEDRPFLDVRAPVEFDEGSLPNAYNLPLLTDGERHEIGICYKQDGPQAALDMGHRLVSGPVKEERIHNWIKFVQQNPNAILYCFRGGQRSGISQKWLRESGVNIPRISGGYKSVRQFLIRLLQDTPGQLRLFSLSGQTGAGKTHVLREVSHPGVIDLEKLANHRGSAFGNELTPQPSQANFENELAVKLMQATSGETLRSARPVIMEDEARTIGKVVLPGELYRSLRDCPLIVIDEDREARVQLILQEYVVTPYNELRAQDPESALTRLKDKLTNSLLKISRKLGSVRTTECLSKIETAIEAGNDWQRHLEWINFLLENYYDAYYRKHLARHSHRIVFQGDRIAVREYIEQLLTENLSADRIYNPAAAPIGHGS